jgi:hypothetical protein
LKARREKEEEKRKKGRSETPFLTHFNFFSSSGLG